MAIPWFHSRLSLLVTFRALPIFQLSYLLATKAGTTQGCWPSLAKALGEITFGNNRTLMFLGTVLTHVSLFNPNLWKYPHFLKRIPIYITLSSLDASNESVEAEFFDNGGVETPKLTMSAVRWYLSPLRRPSAFLVDFVNQQKKNVFADQKWKNSELPDVFRTCCQKYPCFSAPVEKGSWS